MLSKVISQANIDHVEKWFERAEKIVIVTHVSPDGDAIGLHWDYGIFWSLKRRM